MALGAVKPNRVNGARPVGRRGRAAGSRDSRARILAAAAVEFSARGFAGAGIDRIARRARLNKAMIYYHFKSKQALYVVVLEDVFAALGARLRTVASGPGSPAQKIDALIDALARAVDAQPCFVPVMLRELAEGGPRLRRQTLGLIAGIFRLVGTILAEGTRAGVFKPIDPVLAYATMMGPIVMFRASAPVRARIGRLKIAELSTIDSGALVRHLQAVTRRMLCQQPPHA